MKSHLGISFALIAVSIVGFFSIQTLRQYRPPSQITVKGIAERLVTADRGFWGIQFTVRGQDIQKVIEKFMKDREIVYRFLMAQKFQPDEIQFQPPVTREWSESKASEARAFAQEDPSLIHESSKPQYFYEISGVITVKSQQIPLFSKAVDQVFQLIQEGVMLTFDDYRSQPRYYFRNLDSIRPDMISEAVKSAQAVGQQIAKDVGMKLGHLIDSQQGVFSLQHPETGAEHEEDKSMTKRVRVVSSFRFGLQ